LAAFLFLAVFFTQYFNRVFVVAGYYLNQKEYARYCENKSRPEIHCYGKCVMFKKLKQEEKKEKEFPERKAENKSDQTLSSRSFFPVSSCLIFSAETENKFCLFMSAQPADRAFEIFHPPCT